MREVCARCGVAFRGRWALQLIWCKVDEFFVCRRCWESDCGEGHGKGRKNVGKPTWVALATVLTFWLIVGTFAAAAIVDGLQVMSYANLPVTRIALLPQAGVVKVQGTIVDADAVAWGGHESRTRSGWAWSWNTTDVFRVRDASGEVNVTTNRWWEVEPTAHPLPTPHTAGTAYLPGDSVLLVAMVTGSGPSRGLAALYASPDVFRPDPWLPLIAGSALSMPFVLAVVLAMKEGLRRAALQRARLASVAVRDIVTDTTARDDSLAWNPNTGLTFRRRAALALLAAITALVILVLFLVLVPLHERIENFFEIWFVGIILWMGVVAPVAWAIRTAIRPSAMAVSDLGVFFWYDGDYERYLADGFVGWDEVKYIGVRGSGKSTWWALERKDGVSDDLEFLSAANFNSLREAWRRRTASNP